MDFIQLCPSLILDTPRFRYRRETLVRRSVAEMLCNANSLLPKGYRLAIIEGWRAPHIQSRMYQANWKRWQDRYPDWSETKLRRTVNQFTAPMSAKVPPPHTTGGAVDLLLGRDDGSICDHLSPYERYEPASYYFDADGLSEAARETRSIMAVALLSAGLTNYPSEYWHWSYGDQGWAYRGHHPAAVYGSIVPPCWSPAPEDLVDGPLEWVEPPKKP